ncbi:MAG: DUF6088 family protein [Motiliproteus sp.]|nr:DUF6088 family protein [Motiliproteus sp.]MCW9053293.1 DUF6088 family protein [Motiliproteus sp.]
MSVLEKVISRLHRMQRSKPFSITGFYALGSHTSVQKSFSRLSQSGEIVRVSKGIYVRPKPLKSIPSIKITTSAEQVARTWAKEHHYKLVPQGIEEAYRLGLQTQAPVRTVFWSNGPSRLFKVENETVEVRHISEKKLRWLGRAEGSLFRSFSVLPASAIELEGLIGAFKRLSLGEKEFIPTIKKLQSSPLPIEWQKKLKLFEGMLA